MELIVGENTYMTLAEAETLMIDEFTSDSPELAEWKLLSESDKKIAIRRGTSIVDKLIFLGRKVNPDSDLNFPRYIHGNEYEAPKAIKIAILTQSLRDLYMNKKQEMQLQAMGVKEYSVAGAGIKFDSKSTYKQKNGIYTSIYEDYLVKWIY